MWHAARRLASSAAMRPLKVGFVGAGAVGTYFGVRLAELGHDVRFLVRKRHDAPERLCVKSWQGDFALEGPTIAREPAALGDDLDRVLVGLKSTALEQENVLRDLLEACVSATTRVQLLMNGLGAEERAAEIVDAKRVHGGLIYAGLSRQGHDVAHAGVPCAIHGGSFVDDAAELAAAERLWAPVDRARPAGAVAYVPQPCLLLAQWSKLAWNVPFNGCTVLAAGADVGVLWRDAAGRRAAVAVIREVCRAANADLAARGAEASLDEEAVVAKLSAVTENDVISDIKRNVKSNNPSCVTTSTWLEAPFDSLIYDQHLTNYYAQGGYGHKRRRAGRRNGQVRALAHANRA